MFDYAKKAILFVITAVLGTNVASFALRGDWTIDQTWTLVITVVGAVLVFVKANVPSDPEAKTWIAYFVPAVLALQAAISDSSFTADEAAPILIALIGAFQVQRAKNVGDHYESGVAGSVTR